MARRLAILGMLLLIAACGQRRLDTHNGETADDAGADATSDATGDSDRDASDACSPGDNSAECETPDASDGGQDASQDASQNQNDASGDDAVDSTPVCGDGDVEGDESCDDGNTAREACAYGQTSCTVCGPDCTHVDGRTRYCGDGQRQSGQGEDCDDGGTSGGDGCNASCKVENGYICSGSPSNCRPAPSPGTGDAQCEPGYGSGVYDAFPGNNGSYPRGDSNTFGWPGDDFESYADDEIVEARTNKSRRSHLEVTSGTLYARHLQGSQLWKRGWTDTHNFRVLSRATSGGDKVRLTDVDAAVRVYIDNWQSGGPQWSGGHIFARYQTENDLYAASLRKDGQVTIKLKHCDNYTTLASGDFSQGSLDTGTWYDLRFEVVGQRLRFYVDGNLELEAFDDTLSWGTTGVRTDYSAVYLDDWAHR
jgi:cysteine-rich repeat protein